MAIATDGGRPALEIRRLGAADVAVFREIRLEGLRTLPDAFGSDFDIENARPDEWFAERLAGSEVFGAFLGGQIVGMAGFLAREQPKQAHKGFIWGVYVRQQARGRGVARALVEAALATARTRVELVQLTVESGNRAARRLYASFGFVEYGLEKKALKVAGVYADDVLMALDLTES